jgi:tetraacyldisaccharide 4'-kinase
LLTGIANPAPLVSHIKTARQHKIIHHNYADHHQFTLKNIAKLAAEFSACKSQKKVIITTEKDAQRLGVHELLPGCVTPVCFGDTDRHTVFGRCAAKL